jgi:ribosomal protein S27E
MTNTNCLAGISCPNCGNDSVVYIETRTLAVVTDDGAETFGDMEWDADSYAECPECKHRGTVGQFRPQSTAEPTTPTEKE